MIIYFILGLILFYFGGLVLLITLLNILRGIIIGINKFTYFKKEYEEYNIQLKLEEEILRGVNDWNITYIQSENIINNWGYFPHNELLLEIEKKTNEKGTKLDEEELNEFIEYNLRLYEENINIKIENF